MKKLLLVCLLTLNYLSNMTAQTPILDRDLFFGNPQIAAGQLSPDGKWISFMKEYKGIMNVWVKAFNEPFDKARPLTDSQRPFSGYFWTDDSKYILYVKDKDGDENINVFAVNPKDQGVDGNVPESRNLTPLKDVAAQIYMVSDKDPDKLMVGLNDRDKAWHDLYELKISTGKLTLKYENKERVTGYDFDWDENLRLLYKTDEKGSTIMYRIDKDGSLAPIYDFSVTESAYVSSWNEDNTKAYLVSNKGDLNLSTLFLMDPLTSKLTKIESDPKGKVDFGGIQIDRNTRKIICTNYVADKTEYIWRDKNWESNYKFLQSKFPGREISFQSSTKDYSKFLVGVGGDKYASEAYFFDAKTKETIHQYTPRPELKKVEKHLVEMKSISYKSSDGLMIPAYLTLPPGGKTKNLPVVILVHGGPKGPRDYWGYNPQVQFLANRGYAVLQPNFRASGGYGKAFLNAGDLQWGKLMQDDITWGVKHLISTGVADKNKVAIMGGSYGGYATLAGLAFTPDVYACGVDIVGPSNILTLLGSVPAYWEAGRAFLYGMVGDPNTEAGMAMIKAASPLFSADKIVKPLLIIQGANDPRVKKAEADQIVIALRDKGKKVDYLLADDEGHGFAKPVNRMAMYAEVEKFLSTVLGGVYQKDMPADVTKRLAELRVDVKSVTYTPKEETAVSTSLPAIDNKFAATSTDYDLVIEVQGQTIPMAMKRTITQKGDNWMISDVASGQMGEMKDEILFNSNFTPISRNVEQMGMKIPVTYSANKVEMEVQGKPMSMDFKGAMITDGAGMDMIIAGLPLKEGYTINVEMPDMSTMKSKQVTVKVIGKEMLNNIEHTMVEVVSADNENDKITLWINPATKSATKMVQILPAMGNAKMTTTMK
ncbi:MAG: S9 family peptidase [Saprospiraceae bacterium]|nr:S9 family peptidase [Candidatus Brachybacter algidus]